VDRELYPVFPVLVTIRERIWRGDKAREWEKILLESKKTHTRVSVYSPSTCFTSSIQSLLRKIT
jgi:hypothetical protein